MPAPGVEPSPPRPAARLGGPGDRAEASYFAASARTRSFLTRVGSTSRSFCSLYVHMLPGDKPSRYEHAPRMDRVAGTKGAGAALSHWPISNVSEAKVAPRANWKGFLQV